MLRKLLIISVLLLGVKLQAQTLIHSYTDRCSGETKVFSVPMNGQTVIAFYDQSRVFTSQDFQNGILQSWLESVYLRWNSFGPCSQNQATTTATQQTVQQTATEAAKAATAAVTQAPPSTVTVEAPPTVAPITNSTSNETPNIDTGAVGTQNTDPSPQPENVSTPVETNNSNNTEQQGGTEPTQTSDSETQTEDTSGQESSGSSDESQTEEPSSTESEGSEDSSSEEGNESEGEGGDSEETSDDEQTEEETVEEESEEETKEEESSEEESSEESEEEEGDKKEKKKKKKQKNTNPPIIVANVSSMENLLGSFDVAMTIGVSRSSLRGDKTYALNSMIWSNLKQYMLMANYSKVFFIKGRPKYVYSTSLMGSKMYSTMTAGSNHSIVRLGEKGSVTGISAGATNIFLNTQISKEGFYLDTSLLSVALTGFFTKPYNFDRYSISPMVAISSPLFMQDLYSKSVIKNKDLTIITGLSGNYSLTKRFVLNLGINVASNTNKEIKSLLSFTIGSRFQF